jgi:hypothetical protein
MAERAPFELSAMIEVNPFAHNRTTRGVGDAGEAFAFRQLGQDFSGKRMLHSPRNVINLHFVSEADVFAEVKVRDLQVKIGGGVLDEGAGRPP